MYSQSQLDIIRSQLPAYGTLVVVTKHQKVDDIIPITDRGIYDLGESRIESILEKKDHLPSEIRWHYIGPIQSRDIRRIVDECSLIQSVCNKRHAKKIDTCAKEQGKIQNICIQLNLTEEQQKTGLQIDELEGFLSFLNELPNISCTGLMCMGKVGDTKVTSEVFHTLVSLQKKYELQYSSIGMSQDWKEAIYAGGNMLRIGSALF